MSLQVIELQLKNLQSDLEQVSEQCRIVEYMLHALIQTNPEAKKKWEELQDPLSKILGRKLS